MEAMLKGRWLKVLLFLVCLLPLLALAWRALNGGLDANPIEFITHTTGDWTRIFLVLTLSITLARKLLRLPEPIRFRRMIGLFAFFYGFLHFLPGSALTVFRSRRDAARCAEAALQHRRFYGFRADAAAGGHFNCGLDPASRR